MDGDSSSTTGKSCDSGNISGKRTTYKRSRLETPESSLVSKNTADLDDKIGEFQGKTTTAIRESMLNKPPNTDKLKRLLITADFAIKSLEASSHLLSSTMKKIEKPANVSIPSGSNQADANVNEPNPDDTSQNMPSPTKVSSSITYAKHTVTSPATKAIYALNHQVGTFVGLTKSEITCGIKENTQVNPKKKERLEEMSISATVNIETLKSLSDQIENRLKEIEPNFVAKDDLVSLVILDGEPLLPPDIEIVRMMRKKPRTRQETLIWLQNEMKILW